MSNPKPQPSDKKTPPIDAQQLFREAVRALRGGRSQATFSRLLGFRSNVAQRWERGHSAPTAAAFLTACERVTGRLDVAESFLGRRPKWPNGVHLSTPAGVAAFLSEVAGHINISQAARQHGVSRYRLARALTGDVEPSMPFFLRLLEAFSGRALDFLAGYLRVETLPSFGHRWRELELARKLAYEHPWSHAVLRALELDSGTAWKSSRWLASRIGLSPEETREQLARLVETGQVAKRRERFRLNAVKLIDTSRDAARARTLRLSWCKAAIERLESGQRGFFGYNLFAVSRGDLLRIRDLQAQYVQEMRRIVAASANSECVGLFCSQLLDLNGSGENALA